MITRYFMHAGNTSDEYIENLDQTYFLSIILHYHLQRVSKMKFIWKIKVILSHGVFDINLNSLHRKELYIQNNIDFRLKRKQRSVLSSSSSLNNMSTHFFCTKILCGQIMTNIT